MRQIYELLKSVTWKKCPRRPSCFSNKAKNSPEGLNDFFPECGADKSISSESKIPTHQIDL